MRRYRRDSSGIKVGCWIRRYGLITVDILEGEVGFKPTLGDTTVLLTTSSMVDKQASTSSFDGG